MTVVRVAPAVPAVPAVPDAPAGSASATLPDGKVGGVAGRRSWFLGTGVQQAMAESGLVALVLVLPLAAVLRPALDVAILPDAGGGSGWKVLGLSMAYAGALSATTGAVRLRRSAGSGQRWVLGEFCGALAVAAAIWLGAVVAHGGGAALAAVLDSAAASSDLAFARHAPALAGASAVEGLIAYVVARGVALAVPQLNRLRRRRLFWALAQGQLAASLTVVVAISTVLLVLHGDSGRFQMRPPFGPEDLRPGAGAGAVFLAWVATRLLPGITTLLGQVVAVSLLVLPLAALVSYVALRRTTGRLEKLVAAAEALRRGDRAARVEAGGEDEVAHLQTSFNAMAADLGRTLCDLEAERDRVTGLLEARRHLVAAVSHELRTPVATVRGYLESAQRRGGGEVGAPSMLTELRADLDTMAREIGRLERLIEDLFTLSRAEVDHLEMRLAPVDVGALVHRLAQTAAPLAWRRRRVQVVAEVATDVPLAQADAARVEQVVSNLLGNAVRHTPPGGLVGVAVTAEAMVVRVEVRDTGEGISPADLPLVFERFYRASSDRGHEQREHDGAGLGLALVKELTEAMGGTVEAISVPGEGSCFTVRLPRA